MAEIELRDVTKRFADGTEAVRQMNLTIEDGEFMILVGPSGCGKSTALRMIAGLEEISDGELLIGGELVNDLPPRDRDIAMVFQNYALYPHMTVRGNMGFALKLAKLDKPEIAKRVEEAARVLDLTEQLERKPANLSGGQRQRVAMGRAIVRDPAAFLMDEPLSNLDAKLRVQMRAEVSRLQDRLGTTTVYVTHDQTEAMTLGDRVAVMRLGLIQQVGTPDELYERPVNLFVADFIGSPSMNFVPAEVRGDTVHLPFVDVPVPDDLRSSLADGAHVIVGIRPEHIEVAELVPPGQHEGVPFTMRFDLIESMGSEIYAHFDLGAGGIESDQLRELAEDAGLGELPATDETERGIARLSPDAHVTVGRDVELFVHTDRLHYFDPDEGHSLRAKDAAAAVAPAPAP